jgi:hypothetical protein
MMSDEPLRDGSAGVVGDDSDLVEIERLDQIRDDPGKPRQ